MACTNFDIGQHRLDAEVALRSTVLKFRKEPVISTANFIDDFYNSLKNTGLFNLESEAEYVSLSEVLEDFIKTSRRLTDAQKEQLLAEYAVPLSSKFSINPETSTVEEVDKSLVIKDEPEDIQVIEEPLERRVATPSISDIYGSASVVKEYMLNQFRYNIIEASLVNFADGRLIKSNDDLNVYIAKYKNTLFKKLVDYIKLANSEEGIETDASMLDTIYLDGIPNVENMQKVLDVASGIFENISKSALDSAFVSKKRNIEGFYKNQMLVDGFNAWAVLSNGNFDTILKSLFGKNMEIRNKGYVGIELPVSTNKYQFRSGSNMVKTWRTNENVDALSEIGNVSRLLIEQTPVINHVTGEQIGDKYLNLKQFVHSFSKIKDEYNFMFFGERLQDLVLNLHSAPNYYLGEILKEILNSDTRSKVFQVNDLNVFKSIYDKFYNKDKFNSLYNIANRDYLTSKAITTYDLLDSISGVVDRTNNARYVEYALNSDTRDLDSSEIKQSNVNRRKIQRENDIDIANELMADRTGLLNRWGISVNNATTGDVSFTLPYKGEKVTVIYNSNAVSSKGQRKLELSNSDIVKFGRLNTILEEPSFTKLKAIYEENNPQVLTDGERLYVSLIEFIDDFANTGFLRGNVDLLAAFRNVNEANNLDYLDKLVAVASSSAFVNTVYDGYENNNPGNLSLRSYIETLNYYNEKLGDNNERFYYDKTSNSLKAIRPNLINVLNDIVAAEQIVTGEIYKSVIKNAEGNNIPNSRIANLAGLTRSYVKKHILDNPSSALKNTLFGRNPNMLMGTSIKNDAVSRNGIKKSATKFSVAEIGYSSLVYDFYGNLLRPKNGNAPVTINVQPTVYSDKGTFVMWKLGVDKIDVLDENGKPLLINLLTSPTKDIISAIKGTVGTYYKEVFNNVLSDYKEVYRQSLETYLQRLQAVNPEAANRILSKQSKVDAENARIAKHNESLDSERSRLLQALDAAQAAGDFMDAGSIVSALDSLDIKEPVSLVDVLDYQDFTNLLAVTTSGEYTNMSYAAGVPNIDNVHTNKGGSFELNGKTKKGLIPNKLLNFLATEMYAKDDVFNKAMLRERKKFVKDMIDNNMSFPLVYANGRSNTVLRKAADKLLGADKRLWVNENTQELILAKQGNTNITRLSDLDSNWLRDDVEITLNPLIERYFVADFLTSENLRLVTTGSSIAHPNKAKYGSLNPDSFNGIEMEHSSRELAELKRNVIVPATLQYLHQNSLTGVPPWYRIAVMSDVGAPVYNFKGEIAEVDAHDGSAWCNPIMSYLENLSLQDSSVGEDKKPIGHDYNGRYGTAALLKFATFSAYNERLRQSLTSDIKLYNLFKKMSDFKWSESTADWDVPANVDLTVNLFGQPMTLRDVTGGDRIFYRDGNNHYEILGLDKVGNGLYNISKQLVDINGNPIQAVGTANVLIDTNVPINSLFELHAALGGVYSESLRDGELAYSDASLAVTATYVNNIGQYKANGDIPTQRNTNQPLKYKMIAYLVNKSAIKVGAQNINPDSSWYDDSPLMTMHFNTDGLGMQMDADHVVTDPEHQSTMTEFSQVISALESMGFTHDMAKNAYKSLGKVALASIGNIKEAVYVLTGIKPTDNPDVKSDLYEIFGKAIIKELNKNSDELGTAKTIIQKAKEEFALDKKRRTSHGADAYKIPYSDPSIFAKALSTFTSNINKTAIKRKFPGMGAVMAPGYNIIQVHRIGGQNYRYDDLYRIAADEGISVDEYLQREQAKIESEPANSIDRLLPGDRIKIPIQEVTSVVAKINSDATRNKKFAELEVGKYTRLVDQANRGDGEGVELSKAQDNLNKALSKLERLNRDIALTVPQFLEDNGWKLEGEYMLVYVNDYDSYNFVKKNFSTFYTDITRPTDLKPAEIYWDDATGKRHSIFDMPAIQASFTERKKYKKLPKEIGAKLQADVQNTFMLLDKGYMPATEDMLLEYNQDPVAFSKKYVPEGKYLMELPNGNIAIPIQNLVNNPAELVISKLYVNQFNLGPNDSINDVLTQGYQFFVNKYDKYHTPKTKLFDIAFTRGSGKHVYIAFNTSTAIIDKLSVNKTLTDDDFMRVGDSIFRIDKDGNKLYESGYYDAEGNYHELVTSYNAIDGNSVEEVLVVSTPDNVMDIYKTDDFDSIKISQYIKDKATLQGVIEQGKDRSDRLLKGLYDTYTKALVKDDFSVSKIAYELEALEKSRKITAAKKKFVSFQKSLEFTVARIPAQTMQSFMKMKAVAFNDSDKNVVHVSHWQTWLQGSDY